MLLLEYVAQISEPQYKKIIFLCSAFISVQCFLFFNCNRLSHFVPLCDFSVCDVVNCALPEAPRCQDGQTVVLKNPGECQPIHECGMTFTYCDVWGLLCSGSYTHTAAHTHLLSLLHVSSSVFLLSLQKGRVCPSSSPHLSHTSTNDSEKDTMLWRVWMHVQLPELHSHLPCWVHHDLLHQRLWLHRNQLCARQGECAFGWTLSASFSIFVHLNNGAFIVCRSRCVWLVAWFTQWEVTGRKAARSAVAPSYRTKTHYCTLLSVPHLCVIEPALRWDTHTHQMYTCA